MYEDLKNQFISEVKDLLDSTEQNLLLLEQDINNTRYVQEIFRSMHTIKGAAGIYGYNRTVEIAHSFENLFALIRDGKLSIEAKIISLALKAVDVILSLVTSDSEDQVPQSVTQELLDEINTITSNIKKTEPAKKTAEPKQLNTYYILFEPDIDINKRGVKLDSILSDFQDFDYKIITKLRDDKRPSKGKLADYYEIIVASQYSADDLKAIFLFTPHEVNITQIADFNLFADNKFLDFYDKAVKIVPDTTHRLKLLQDYASKIHDKFIKATKQTDLPQTEKSEKQEPIIGIEEIKQVIDETKQKYLQYIKIPAKKLDLLLSLVSELIINNSQLTESSSKQDYEQVLQLSENISKIINEIKETTLHLRLIEIKTILPPYYRLVRDLSLKLGKKVDFIVEGSDTHIDKTIIDKLSSPLMHILRNALDHGIEPPEERRAKGKRETGIVRFIAYYSNTNVIIQIQDDGRGIDPEKVKQVALEKGFITPDAKLTKKEIYDLLFTPGFSMAKKITDISGRGVGMDAIKKAILDLRGDIEVDSEVDLGTSITIKLPLTLSIIETLHVSSANMHFLIPLSNVIRCDKINFKQIPKHSGQRIVLDDQIIPYIDITQYLGLDSSSGDEKNLILINGGRLPFALFFDDIHGEYQAVIKNLGPIFNNLDIFIGASILADGSVAYILDTYKLQKKFFRQANINQNI